jgi:hypothetical protein
MTNVDIKDMEYKIYDRVYTNDYYELVFENEVGRYVFYHRQDCCERVYIEEIVGDLNDLAGHPLFLAEEVSGYIGPEPDSAESYTWTFYKFATPMGHVTVRWLGVSNGYYGERVDLEYEPKINGRYVSADDELTVPEWEEHLLGDEQ